MNKFNKLREKPLQRKLCVTEERTQRRHQKMERLPMLMDCRINTVEIAILSKAISMFNVILINIPKTFFTTTEKLILNFIAKK
jgi:hypothetical protein